MGSYEQRIINEINHLLALIEQNFQIERVIKEPPSDYRIILVYDRGKGKRKYMMLCKNGMALKKTYHEYF